MSMLLSLNNSTINIRDQTNKGALNPNQRLFQVTIKMNVENGTLDAMGGFRRDRPNQMLINKIDTHI
jgi:hypothetical protein